MKHIFTVHSPITFFAAYCIVKHLELPENDVIVVAAGYNPPLSLGSTVSAYQDSEKGIWKKITNIDLPKSHDKYIDALIDGYEFHAYIDLMHAYQRLLVTHKQCKGFSFMEEGTASYVVPDKLDFISYGGKQVGYRNTTWRDYALSMLRSIRGVNMRLLSMPYHPQAYVAIPNMRYFTFSEAGYPGISEDHREILQPEGADPILLQLAYAKPLNNAVVWVEESFPKVFGVPDSEYALAIDSMIDQLKEGGYAEVYLKLRPGQTEQQSMVFQRLVNNGLAAYALPSDCIAEALLLTSKELTVIGLVSSLLFYASIWGHQSISFLDKLPRKPKTHFDDLEAYWSIVKLSESY